MGKRQFLEIIPLPLIPLPFPGLPKKKTAGKKMEAKKSPDVIFLPPSFCLLFFAFFVFFCGHKKIICGLFRPFALVWVTML
jgi:hypothetical protein